MKVLVLGSHGTIGTSVCKYFNEKGHTVIPWDIKNSEEQDLRVAGNLDTILPTVDFVLFLAFDVGGSKYNINSIQYINNNISLLMNTFTSLSKCPKPFIHTTSQMSSMNHNSYSVLKRLAEMYTTHLGNINLKIWNVYGNEPINEKSHVIPDFIHQVINGDCIQMRTKGLEERQFLYCDDFSAGIYTIFENYSRFANSDKCIDISNFQWVSIRTIATIIADIAAEKLGKIIEIKDGDGIDTFQVGPRNEPAISELNSLWNPVVSLREGISSIFDSILQSKTE